MERDPDSDGLIVLCEDFSAQEGRHQCSNSLLTIDKNSFASGKCAVLELDRWVAPRDQIADRITLVERVQEISDLRCLPYERALNLRDRDLAGFDPRHQRVDRM